MTLNCPECGTEMEEHDWCVVDGVRLKKCVKGFVCPKCGKVIKQ